MSYFSNIGFKDSSNFDSFSRLRVSVPEFVFDGQLTYDLQPLLFEPITSGTGAAITHDSTNRSALMTFASTTTGGKCYMQTYEHFRYTAGRSQLVLITFNMVAAVANVLKFAGYSDGGNGIEFQLNGTTKQFIIYSGTSNGNETATQSNWNIDKLDGTGKSGITLDITKTQILVLDFQALYVGRVRIGFDIDGVIIFAHEFLHANTVAYPYLQSANLPLRIGMTCSGTVSTTMNFICCSVIKEDGNGTPSEGYNFVQGSGSKNAANGARTHFLSIQPRLTFNSIVNRTKFEFNSVDILVFGNNPIKWELCIGDVITGTTAFNNVNTTYSAFGYNILGTTSAVPLLILDAGYVSATNQSRGRASVGVEFKYPICLDAAGAARSMGRLTLLLTGLGGASECYASIKWKEIR